MLIIFRKDNVLAFYVFPGELEDHLKKVLYTNEKKKLNNFFSDRL